MTDTPPPASPRRAWISITVPRVSINFPDTRGWVALGLFALTGEIFWMIYERPSLTANQGFMFLAQAIVVSGLIGGVVAFLFAASKGAADANARADAVIAKLPDKPE